MTNSIDKPNRFASALTRRSNLDFDGGDTIDIRPPEDSSSYTKHSRDWYKYYEAFNIKGLKDLYLKDINDDYLRNLVTEMFINYGSLSKEVIDIINGMMDTETITVFRHHSVIHDMIEDLINSNLSETPYKSFGYLPNDDIAIKSLEFNKMTKTIKSKDDIMYACYRFKNHIELAITIYKLRQTRGNYLNLNWIDVSNIRNMSCMFSIYKPIHLYDEDDRLYSSYPAELTDGKFSNSHFEGDISLWDTSNV